MPKINVKLTPRVAKKWGFIVLVLIVLLFVLIRFHRDSAFRVAKKAFNEQDYMYAAELFAELGTYSDSDSYVTYCHALQMFTEEDYESATTLFEQLGTFQKSSKYLLYTQAMIAYQNMEYWHAAELFEECGDTLFGHTEFLDSDMKARLCYFNTGTILEGSGDYARAIICYELAGDYEDAPERLVECEKMLAGANYSGT